MKRMVSWTQGQAGGRILQVGKTAFIDCPSSFTIKLFSHHCDDATSALDTITGSNLLRRLFGENLPDTSLVLILTDSCEKIAEQILPFRKRWQLALGNHEELMKIVQGLS